MGRCKCITIGVILLTPYIGQENLYNNWDLDQPIDSPQNRPLGDTPIRMLRCGSDISISNYGDLSYVVNGGWGFTTRTEGDVGDCPVDRNGQQLDLNGDGASCTGNGHVDELDQKRFKQLGLFFVENWKRGQLVSNRDFTKRFHSMGDILDGSSQTFLITENARTGYDPDDRLGRFFHPHPMRTMFFVGNPCDQGECSQANVDYAKSNSGDDQINSGLDKPEGESPVPNSFHQGGVNMAFADGHVTFFSQATDGSVYAALSSPQGMLLDETPISQVLVSGEQF